MAYPASPDESIPCRCGNARRSVKVLDILADYDMFQFENRVKPDYCNAQGLEEWDEQEDGWCEWYSEDGLDIKEYREQMEDRR